MSLEVNVMMELLFDVSKLQTVEINGKWFKNKNLRYIVEYLKETDGDDDFIMMADKISQKHPDFEWNKNDLINMATESVSNSRLEKHVKELKVRYYEGQLADYSRQFATKPSVDRLNAMKTAMNELDDVKNEGEEFGIRGAVDELYYELEHGMKSGVHTFEQLDMILGDGLSGGMLVTIGARPSVGKTTFGMNMLIEGLKNHEDFTGDLFSLEMTKKEMLKKFISRLTGINSYKFVNTKLQLSKEEKNRVVANAEWLAEEDLTIHDDKFHIDDIIRTIKRRKHESKGRYVAFIDYLQLVKSTEKANRYLEIGEITRELKQVANQLDIPIVIFSQLSRGIESRQTKKPVLSDLRESGDIEQDSSVVLFLSKDEEEDGLIDLTVAKNRNGALAEIKYRFFRSKSEFVELVEE